MNKSKGETACLGGSVASSSSGQVGRWQHALALTCVTLRVIQTIINPVNINKVSGVYVAAKCTFFFSVLFSVR